MNPPGSTTGVSRREVLLGTAAGLGLSGLRPTRQTGRGRRVAIFLPGIMSSVLTSRTGAGPTEIWSRSIDRTMYGVLLRNPELLRFTGRPIPPGDTDVLDSAHYLFLTWRYSTGLLGLLEKHDDFQRAGGLLRFSYDWRQDFREILGQLATSLRDGLGLEYDRGRALEHPDLQVFVIGHSMGGVLAFLAVAGGLIHPNNVARLVLLAPPLGGAAAAFRSLFDVARFPVLREAYLARWGRNFQLAWTHLHDVIGTFPSTYQLMPPAGRQFVHDRDTGGWIDPFGQLPEAGAKAARDAHAAIAQGFANFPVPRGRVHLIYGTGIDTETEYHVTRKTTGGALFSLVPPGALTDPAGDGTVTAESATYGGQMAALGTTHYFELVEHSTMCDSPRVLDLMKTLL